LGYKCSVGYVAIDYDGGVTVFDTYPTEHLFSKTWDINDIDDDFVEIGTINRLVSDWENMLQPIGNANFVL
jgi:predicted alpha/beta hydrolase family esterase